MDEQCSEDYAELRDYEAAAAILKAARKEFCSSSDQIWTFLYNAGRYCERMAGEAFKRLKGEE